MKLIAVLAVVPVLSGCAGEPSDPTSDCTSHYEQVAQAPTLAALKVKLVEQTPRAVSVRVVGRDGEKRSVNVLSRHPRNLLSLDVWQRDDGRWTAEQWSQCID